MKYLCGRCIHIDVCLVPRSIGCVEECKHFKEMPSHLPKQTNEEYLRSCNTEQLAEAILQQWIHGAYHGVGEFGLTDKEIESSREDIVEWLKQPHQ